MDNSNDAPLRDFKYTSKFGTGPTMLIVELPGVVETGDCGFQAFGYTESVWARKIQFTGGEVVQDAEIIIFES